MSHKSRPSSSAAVSTTRTRTTFERHTFTNDVPSRDRSATQPEEQPATSDHELLADLPHRKATRAYLLSHLHPLPHKKSTRIHKHSISSRRRRRRRRRRRPLDVSTTRASHREDKKKSKEKIMTDNGATRAASHPTSLTAAESRGTKNLTSPLKGGPLSVWRPASVHYGGTPVPRRIVEEERDPTQEQKQQQHQQEQQHPQEYTAPQHLEQHPQEYT